MLAHSWACWAFNRTVKAPLEVMKAFGKLTDLVPSMLTYANNNILKASERSFASALMIGWGGIGGIITSTTFRQVG